MFQAKVPIINLMMELGSKKHKTKPSPIVWIPVGDADTVRLVLTAVQEYAISCVHYVCQLFFLGFIY